MEGAIINYFGSGQEYQQFVHGYSTVGDEPSYDMVGYLTTGPQERTGSFQFSARASSLLSPIPEPAESGMLLAGAVVLGAVARRKARTTV